MHEPLHHLRIQICVPVVLSAALSVASMYFLASRGSLDVAVGFSPMLSVVFVLVANAQTPMLAKIERLEGDLARARGAAGDADESIDKLSA